MVSDAGANERAAYQNEGSRLFRLHGVDGAGCDSAEETMARWENAKRPARQPEQPSASTGRQTALPALSEVTPRHIGYVRKLVARLGVYPAHEQEDLVQEVLIQAHRSQGSALEPRALLSGITRHLVFRWISKREHERGLMQSKANEVADEPPQRSAEEDWQAAERHQAVHESIDELPDIFKDVFVRCELEEMPMAEVAKDLGIPVNTGYTRLHLARARFAEAVRRLLARRRLRNDDL